MTDPTYTHVEIILDRSGSMAPIKSDMEGGISAMLSELMNDLPDGNRITVGLVQFDSTIETMSRMVPIDKFPPVRLTPRGSTSLLDALGSTITQLGQDLEQLPQEHRPSTVIVVVITDGHENSSVEWTKPQVRELIERQQSQFNWQFSYLGAEPRSFGDARGLGFRAETVSVYNKSSSGTRGAFLATASAVSRTRGGEQMQYTDQEREEMSRGDDNDA